MKPEAFITLIQPVIEAMVPGIAAQRIVIAHAALESGWGISRAFMVGRNLFNITRLPNDPRPVILSGDREYGKDGTVRKIKQRFAAYDNYSESVKHYMQFIAKSRYHLASERLIEGDLAGFVSALFKGGYFTLPLARYLGDMASVYDRVNKELNK